jgi:hypothetical protein
MLRTVWFEHRAFGVVLSCLASLPCGLVVACSGQTRSQGSGGDDLAGGTCNVVPKSVSGLTRIHIDECSPITYPDNPPTGGNHYPVWAAYQTFSFAVPRGFWVHNLEHGAVVYTYNCADGCPGEVADVQALIDALPIDEGCVADEPRRVVLTPDPLLDVRWGVSAWGHTLRADCVDDERFRQFYLNHFGQGPEVVCAEGSDFNGVPPCQ